MEATGHHRIATPTQPFHLIHPYIPSALILLSYCYKGASASEHWFSSRKLIPSVKFSLFWIGNRGVTQYRNDFSEKLCAYTGTLSLRGEPSLLPQKRRPPETLLSQSSVKHCASTHHSCQSERGRKQSLSVVVPLSDKPVIRPCEVCTARSTDCGCPYPAIHGGLGDDIGPT